MKTILLPTDFSRAARPALELGVKIAARTGAKIIFFHLAYFSEDDTGFPLSYAESYDAAIKKAKDKLRKEAESVLGNFKQRIKHDTEVGFGPSASDAILDITKEKEISLVVIGTHGASGIKKVFFGSNTAHLISRAHVPVLAVPYGKQITEPRKLYYSTDLINTSKELDVVKRFCKKTDLKLELVFVDYGWARSADEETVLAKLRKQPLQFTVLRSSLEHPVHKVLARFMKDKSGGMLCMFHQRKSGIAAFLFGSSSESLAAAPKFPLLIFPK